MFFKGIKAKPKGLKFSKSEKNLILILNLKLKVKT